MPYAFWFLLPMGTSLGLNYMGSQAAAEATAAGAGAQANIEKMNMVFQTKMFEKSIEAQKPFYEAGLAASEEYQTALSGERDPLSTGLGEAKKEELRKTTASMSEYVKKLAFERLGAEEGERAKSRLLDIQQIGLGSAGSAGGATVNYGSALARSRENVAGTAASAITTGAIGKQNLYTNIAESLSGVPALSLMYDNFNTIGYPALPRSSPLVQPMSNYQNLMPAYTRGDERIV